MAKVYKLEQLCALKETIIPMIYVIVTINLLSKDAVIVVHVAIFILGELDRGLR